MHGHGGQGHEQDFSQNATTPADNGAPFLTPDKIILLLGLVTYGIGQSILFVVFPPLVEQIGLTLTQFGLIFSISNLMLALAAVYWGRMSDKVGRKPLLMLGLFGYALGTAIVALSLEWGLRGSPAPWLLFAVIVFARLIYAGLASAINPSAIAYLADTTTREQRARGMALLGMSSGIGTMLGPVIGGSLAFISVIFPLYVAIALALLALVLIAVMLKEPEKAPVPTHAEGKKLKWHDSRIRPFLIMFFCLWTFFTLNQITIAFYLEKVIGIEGSASVARATATALFCMAIWAVLMQAVVIQKLQVKPGTMLRIGSPVFALGMVTLLIADSMFLVCVAFSMFGVSMALGNAGIAGGASLSVEPHEQGAIGGLLSAAPILGMVAGPLLGPVLFDQFGPTVPVTIGAIAFTLLSVYAFTIRVPDK
ncbi:MAG: MFS transporter [Gammaproteobacteria bacterium]|nr:MAG: MFS transporter [Gammaproteobacteria bacterium]